MLGDSALRTPRPLDECLAEAGALLAHDDPRPRSGGGSTGRSSASRDAICSASPTCGPSAPSSPMVAQACLGVARSIAAPEVPMALIGVGKLGGAELNYASDVDVLFVHDGESAEAERAARAVLRVMTEPSADGIVFRTDADLRPEGRAGPAQPHARCVRGVLGTVGADVGAPGAHQGAAGARRPPTSAPRSSTRREPFVWPDVLDPDAVREIRAMKARTEEMLTRKGTRDARAEARVRRHPRHRVRGAAAPTRARPPRPIDPLPRDARRARRSSPPAATSTIDDAAAPRRGVHLAADRRAPVAARRRAPDAHACPPTRGARTHLARVLGFRDRPRSDRARGSSTPRTDGARRSCARSTRSCSSRRCSTRSPASARCPEGRGAGTAGRVRLPRRRPDPRRAARAHGRAHAPFARDAAAAARRSSAGSPTHPIPTSGCWRCAG